MSQELLFALLEHPSQNVRDLTAALFAGEDCWFALHDALEEVGIDATI